MMFSYNELYEELLKTITFLEERNDENLDTQIAALRQISKLLIAMDLLVSAEQ